MDANLNHWSVTVAVDGDDVLTISHNHLAGKDGLDDLAPAIRTAAAHLLCFIGAGKDIGGGNVALAHSDAVQAPIYQIQYKTGAETTLWFDVTESEWHEKLDEEFDKRIVYPAPTARTVNAKPVAYRWVSYAGSFSVLTYGEQAPEFAFGVQPLYAAPVAPAAASSALASLVEFNPEHPLIANAEQPEEVWSADRETFDCDSLCDLLDSNELEVGQTVYVGEKVPVDATSYIEVEILLDSLGDRAFDHVGEAADGYPDVTQEARDELEALLSAWVQKNAKPNFYRVKKIREYTITQQDIGAAQ